MTSRAMARPRYETTEYFNVADAMPARNWLNEEGNKALRHLHLNGACRDLGPDAFFPRQGCFPGEAYATCATCDVRPECLSFALSTTEREGVWGGCNETARRPLMRRVAAGEDPDEVAADHCRKNPVRVGTGRSGRRSNYSAEVRATAVRLCAEVGPGIASERTGVPATTVKGWLTKARGDITSMTDEQVRQLVTEAVRAATATMLEDLNRGLAEVLAELGERLDALTAATSTALHVLAPLDPALAQAAASLDSAKTGDV